jgi:alkylation response protein AidB-like acyl-CoA dehydrogenase
MATAVLLAAGDEDVLPSVASGKTTAVLVLPLSTPPGAPVPGGIRAVDGALAGTVTGVADALAADLLLVPTHEGLWAVDAAAAALAPRTSLDLTRGLADVTFDAAPARLVAGPDAVGAAWRAALTTGAALLAGEQLGVAQWCLDTTVEYLKTRYQFGRPVGSFQALKHRLAELWVAVTQARAVARYAAGCMAGEGSGSQGKAARAGNFAGDPDLAVAVAVAQAHCSPVAVRAAEECIQLHGGIGFTWEYPAHLYLKRAKSAAIALGTAERHRAALAGLVDLLPA